MSGPIYSISRRDNSEPEVVKAFREGGATVDFLPGGNGRPDLLVGFMGTTHTVETKTNRAKLRPGQERWAEQWGGEPPVVARTGPQARKWLTVWRQRVEAKNATPIEESPLDTPASSLAKEHA